MMMYVLVCVSAQVRRGRGAHPADGLLDHQGDAEQVSGGFLRRYCRAAVRGAGDGLAWLRADGGARA